jgi:hypothetical protein
MEKQIYRAENEKPESVFTLTVVGTELTSVRVCEAIAWEDVVKYASRCGIAEFTVATPRTATSNPTNLRTEDFPYPGDVVVFEHNTAKIVPE